MIIERLGVVVAVVVAAVMNVSSEAVAVSECSVVGAGIVVVEPVVEAAGIAAGALVAAFVAVVVLADCC